MTRCSGAAVLLTIAALASSPTPSSGWPAMYTDCSVFPSLGEPQLRPQQHPAMALICEPTPPTSFEWCMGNCAVVHTKGKQNCSASMCTCTEHCMNSADVCTTNIPHADPTHKSLPDALAAKPGATGLLLDGVEVTKLGGSYSAGGSYRLTVQPASGADAWFLLDAGIGAFTVEGLTKPNLWKVACDGSRASFMSPRANTSVSLRWQAPPDAAGQLVLRVAEATGMGNLTVTAAILNASTTPGSLAPSTEMGYACVVGEGLRPGGGPPTRQCMSVPVGTVGALTKPGCEQECLAGAGAVYRCLRCDHVYDAAKDGKGVAFEDLPDSWVCPICGAPKSAYAKQTQADGTTAWAH